MKRVFIYIIMCVAAAPLMSQTDSVRAAAAAADKSSLAQLISVGLNNNYGLRIVRNEERLAESNATRANAGMLPKVGVTAGYNGDLSSTNTTQRPSGATEPRLDRVRRIQDSGQLPTPPRAAPPKRHADTHGPGRLCGRFDSRVLQLCTAAPSPAQSAQCCGALQRALAHRVRALFDR